LSDIFRRAAIVFAIVTTAVPAAADNLDDTSADTSMADPASSDDSDLYSLPDVETMLNQPTEENNFLLVPSDQIDSDMEWMPNDTSGSMLSLDPAEDPPASP
jgi:hypothetical protein